MTLIMAAGQASAQTRPAADLAAEAINRFIQGDSTGLYDMSVGELKNAIGSPENLDKMRSAIFGTDKSPVIAESAIITRTVVGAGGQAFDVVATVNDKGELVGFSVRPARSIEAPTTRLAYATKTKLRLPFDGAWTVVWGGRTVKQNYHAAYTDQRFAYDLLMVKDGATHSGDGKKNTDYYCYNQPILAPAAGRVVELVDGIPENTPGQMNPKAAAGNHLMLDFGNGEFGLFAHLIPNSLTVKLGDEVKPGQKLGLCGNSGNSSEPHLHFHLQDNPTFGKGRGFPVRFLDYKTDGKPTAQGEPVKGEVIENAAAR